MIEFDPTVAYQLKSVFKEFVLPPHGFITLIAVGVLWARFRRHGRRFGTGLALVALLALYLSVIPPGSQWLMQQVERDAGVGIDQAGAQALMRGDDPPQAIVILGGGRLRDKRERPYTTNLSPEALQRVHAGARLARWTQLPVLTSGGSALPGEPTEGDVMARVLKQDLLTAVRWIESGSLDTADNASMSVKALKGDGISHILLVTSASHIPRGRAAFESLGLRVTPAPVGFRAGVGVELDSYWIPRQESVHRATIAYRELVGQFWYWLRRTYLSHWFDATPVVAANTNRESNAVI